ncbi:LmbE family protein [Chthoniobacter flavus Ellin428]|uniref:LmbE family protein n=1 Tax=Chthoniobacter flavus Ellin428 TaxID=497964 RepID=B4D7X1_9BACT|nr:PIG-L family deacetylase [Chthoniobacter flavus]EDY17494.1 LmbE family protein [Chthoniobacter flavus Ellin428]
MQLRNPSADIFIPDGKAPAEALERVTRLGVGAHQDDLEFMAFHGIQACYHSDEEWFGGVTCTNGSGSSRTGAYAKFTDEQMMAVRRQEQRQAAIVGRYGAMIQLDYPSKVVKDPAEARLKDDLKDILAATQPRVVYTHNPADKHDTHVAVVVPVIQAIRELPREQRPQFVYGCEVWRDLDWLPDAEKVVHDVCGHENLAASLNGLFDSQIAGGKRYDLAVIGRRRANATFFRKSWRRPERCAHFRHGSHTAGA